MYKKMGTLALTGALAFSLAACGGTEETAKKVSSDPKSEQSTDKKEEKKEFKVGETIQLGDHKLTVSNIEKSQGGEFDKPKEDHEFVIANVTIENGGKEEISYNPFDFSLQNSEGNIVNETFTTVNQNTQLNAGQLAPNGKVSGSIAFEVKQGDPKLQLIFKPNFLSKKEIRINLQ
ncbi:DUF4352 domain-containing protein [Bacillus clarus]|uniref:DUF4352 domain-containing protein n=1 Tax=Bacillus clarus TaxID=2338372 RepID=A0A090Y9M7_9BACI|nr:DUF4352 domain-containing protein [Bacillus clarus]KFM95164.1 hypothetical protein DJ93_5660 [Bacillus clarus]RFT62961.1 DUF4352 domain-containing protein [Bacillus clarus]